MVQPRATPEPQVSMPAASPTATNCAARRLHVWVVGNPVSGGKRGGTVMDELETRFREQFGDAAVHATSSSTFLRDFPPHELTPAPSCSADNGGSAHHTASNTAPRTEQVCTSPLSKTSCQSVSALSAVWAATGVSTPVTAASAEPVVRTLIIRTDQGGHTKAVSHALSRLILQSRLEEEDRWRASGTQQQQQHQQLGSTTLTNKDSNAEGVAPSVATHHVVLVVGGDGTLSEATNGLCEGTLAAFAALTSCTDTHLASGPVSSRSSLSSHAQVEQEAAVLSHLLPAVLYVPGGTGSDFAKLGLCCNSAEDALRVVRDGLLRQLFSSTACMTEEKGSCGTAANKVVSFCGLSSRARAAVSVPPPNARSPASPFPMPVAAYAVDVGRIEFLRTGRRHFFINECSTGMSCDVIRRGERFKQSKWISKLGGLLLFAASAFVSLMHMTPTPLYICKLPSRTKPTATSPPSGCGGQQDGVLGSRKADDSAEGGMANVGEDIESRPCAAATETTTTKTTRTTKHDHREATAPRADSLTTRAPFAPFDDVLHRLRAQLRWSGGWSTSSSTSITTPATTTSSNLHMTNGAEAEAITDNATGAYATHRSTPMPPPHAKTVRCTLQTPSDQLLQLLDLTDAELLAGQGAEQQQPKKQRCTGGPTGGTSTTASLLDAVEHCTATEAGRAHDEKNVTPSQPPRDKVNHRSTAAHNADGDERNDDDLAALTWVEVPSSMVAFANGRWYGGGMLVAPHANPTDGLLSCTNWVATILPFISGVVSLYTGRHVHWRSTSAFDGQRFLVTSIPPTESSATSSSLHTTRGSAGGSAARAEPADEAGNDEEAEAESGALFMEADGEVLEAAPAIVELTGKLTFLVPSTAAPNLGNPAPGTARERAGGWH